MRRAAVLREVPPQSLPKVGLAGKRKTRWHNTHDGIVAGVEANVAADDRRIGVEALTPESIADDGLQVVEYVEAGVVGERRTDLRTHAEHAEEIATRLDGRHAHGIAI